MAVLVWASWSDLTKREIPNAAAVLLGLTAVVDAWIGGSPLQAGWLGCISILIVGFPVSAYLGLIGAGDIKLMGLIVGFSGLWDGIFILGLGFVIAAVSAACRMTRQGTVWLRLERIARFAVESGINGKITEYPGYFEKESLMRLGPYLFAGYCLFLLIR